MRPRLLIIIIIGLIAIGAVISLVVRMGGDSTESPLPNDPEATLPVVTTSTNNGGVTFSTARGTVRTRDFYADALSITEFEVTLFDTPDAGAIYLEPTVKSLNIVVYAGDLAQFRARRPLMEQKFLELMAVTPDDACKLPVFLSAFAPGVESLSNGEFGLSFCPGAIATP